jgi:hypothetical protein
MQNIMEYNLIAETVSKLIGKAPWDVRLGEGSFLTMEFGKPEANPTSHVTHGEWHLWLYMCMWRIETQEAVLAGSEDDRSRIKKLLENLAFKTIEDIRVARPSLDLSIEFTSGVKLFTFADTTRSEEQWKLFTPDGNVLIAYGGGAFHCVGANEPRYVPNNESAPSAGHL